MGAKVFIYIEENKCGYTFKNKRRRMKGLNFPPEPYSKLSPSGEEIILSKEEVEDWTKAYFQAIEELGACMFSRDEAVYRKVDEILKETGNYRFL
jgi:hypothetical protein